VKVVLILWGQTLSGPFVRREGTLAVEKNRTLHGIVRSSMWAFTGKQCRRCGVNRERADGVEVFAHEIAVRMLVADDSGTVVMKVEIRYEVCNNLPAEATSSENG